MAKWNNIIQTASVWLLVLLTMLIDTVSAIPIGRIRGDFSHEAVLSRHARSTNGTSSSGSGGIVEFFEDNNNKAMYLVLPLIILVYGGCSAIYCVAKCRRYIRKRNRQKKHKLAQLTNPPTKQSSPPDNPPVNGLENLHNPMEKEPSSRSESQNSIPGQIVEHDDKVPLVASTARQHTPAPSLQDDRLSRNETPNVKSSRISKTPVSIEMDEMYSRNSDNASMASKAALFTVSNTRRDSPQTPSNRNNRDMVTPSTSRQDMQYPSHPPPRYTRDDPKAGFKAMLQGTNYNPLYSHNADPWESMRAMDRKAMGQTENSAPWSNHVKYDEFGRPKPQKKQRLIFVA